MPTTTKRHYQEVCDDIQKTHDRLRELKGEADAILEERLARGQRFSDCLEKNARRHGFLIQNIPIDVLIDALEQFETLEIVSTIKETGHLPSDLKRCEVCGKSEADKIIRKRFIREDVPHLLCDGCHQINAAPSTL